MYKRQVMDPILSGEFTVHDKWLYEYMRALIKSENIFNEPSSCAAFEGPLKLNQYEETRGYLQEQGLLEKLPNACLLYTSGRSFRKWVQRMC